MTVWLIRSHRRSNPRTLTEHRITAQTEAAVREALRIADARRDVDICSICAAFTIDLSVGEVNSGKDQR